jgi:hypothetical protein
MPGFDFQVWDIVSEHKNHLEEAIALLELNAQAMREALSLLRSHAIAFEERTANYCACKKCLSICYTLEHLRSHKCSG